MNLMGRDRFEEQTPDLFPTEGLSGPSSNKVEDVKPRRPRRPALPKHLPTAIKYLNNEDLDRLLRAATEGARRRGRLAPNPETPNKIEPLGEPSSKQSSANSSTTGEDRSIPLTQGQVNAVRSTFRAGVTPSRMARQFGLSQAQVREALSSDKSTR